MSAIIIDGKKVAQQHLEHLAQTIAHQKVTPGLVVIQLGNDPASSVYVNNKIKKCRAVGINPIHEHLPETTSQTQLIHLIQQYNQNHQIHGILVQLPLPDHIDINTILSTIDPTKDVDGFHPINFGHLAQGSPLFIPCTPKGIMMLLQQYTSIKGKLATIIGASTIVGRPVAFTLLNEKATPVICHSQTPNLPEIVHQSDIVIAAAGQANLVKSDWLAPNTTVIDVGINRQNDGQLIGDVAFDAREKVAAITPVPGGVGPMTIAMLLDNTWQAYQQQTQ